MDEEEFVEVRTNRNRYKITREEQEILRTKKVGVIGLSVGQSIALTMVMERTCGEIRLADFDTAELSNLNRIRTGVQNLGLRKTVIAAREIAEIDPFVKVKIFNDGITKENLDSFFLEDGKLDLLVEVCDGLDIKIVSRFKARELKIPVVMDTNDRGMLDIERYDLEPEREILHGLAAGLNPENIKDLTNEEKIPYILKMVGSETLSTRLKASMIEVEQSINTWPQLASSVVLGGAITTDVVRRIFLNELSVSGRFYVDMEDLIKNDKQNRNYNEELTEFLKQMPEALEYSEMESIASSYVGNSKNVRLNKDEIDAIIEAGIAAPSGGNSQPWKFLYDANGMLFLFHDIKFSYSLLDYANLGSYLAFGAVIENMRIMASSLGYKMQVDVFPLENDRRLVAAVTFSKEEYPYPFVHLKPAIVKRVSNRTISDRKLISKGDKEKLERIAADSPEGAKLLMFEDENDLKEFEDILTNSERIRFLNVWGHHDTFKELRLTKEEVLRTRDGLDADTLNMRDSDKAALEVSKDVEAIQFLHERNLGNAFKNISRDAVLSSSLIAVLCMPNNDEINYLKGGQVLERLWLTATSLGISLQPISQIVFMLERLKEKTGFDGIDLAELNGIKQKFQSLLRSCDNHCPVFVFRLCLSEAPTIISLRKAIESVTHYS